jgi:phage protein U
MTGTSFLDTNMQPSAMLGDGILYVPLWAVSTLSLSATYHTPPIGSTGARAMLGSHDDTIVLSAVLPGPERFRWKIELEQLAEASRRGSALAGRSGGAISGLVFASSMTTRTDIYVQSLSFTATAARRDVLDVSMTLAHMPLPSSPGRLLDMAAIGVRALSDFS